MKKLFVVLLVLFGLIGLLLILVKFYPYKYNFVSYPKITYTASKAPGDPINMIFVGSKAQIIQSFQRAGWYIPDPINPQTSSRIAVDSLLHKSYPMAPVSNLYVYGGKQDMAFEYPTNDVQNRGHIRLWDTGKTIGNVPIWIAQASYDHGIELSGTNHFPTHHILPSVDAERDFVASDLENTHTIKNEILSSFTQPIFYAQNGGGDYYESDGNVMLINYVSPGLTVSPDQGLIYPLKNWLFMIYTSLLQMISYH